MNPKVSIVIPSFNHSKFIKKTINSARTQTYKNIEIIIGDDSSSDSSAEIIKKIASQDSRINFFVNKKNIGAHNTINKAINIATGRYIAILNSDDIFLNNKIERCLQIVKRNNSIEVISGNAILINSFGFEIKLRKEGVWKEGALDFYKKSQSLFLAIMYRNFILSTSNIFFSKSIWKKNLGFQNLRYCHDLEFILACIVQNKIYYDSDFNHIKYRYHSNNTISENIELVNHERSKVLSYYLSHYGSGFIKTSQEIDDLKKILIDHPFLVEMIVQLTKVSGFKNKKTFFDSIT
jgi:glycosyltransferase involved in cell wall biosynthesis